MWRNSAAPHWYSTFIWQQPVHNWRIRSFVFRLLPKANSIVVNKWIIWDMELPKYEYMCYSVHICLSSDAAYCWIFHVFMSSIHHIRCSRVGLWTAVFISFFTYTKTFLPSGSGRGSYQFQYTLNNVRNINDVLFIASQMSPAPRRLALYTLIERSLFRSRMDEWIVSHITFIIIHYSP